jgi:lipoate-protein ligase A
MLIYLRPYTDPFLNIAAEEYYVKNTKQNMCMIWINDRSVIIGKHQNAFAEINYPFVKENSIPVIRRISGGGAVYHDKGNVNFSFIQQADKTNLVSFGKFTSVIISFMKSLGIEVNVSKRNSLFIGNGKFSGHAEHIFHDKVLHHGTILFNTDLDALQNSISPVKEYQSKAMPSVRSEVMNIAPLLPFGIDIQQFANEFTKWLLSYYQGSSIYTGQIGEQEAIKKLAEDKYKTWEWNYGYSPAYTFRIRIQGFTENVDAAIKVENGRFSLIEVDSNEETAVIARLLKSMTGILHKEEEIDTFIEKNLTELELAGVNTVSFRQDFFG